MAEVNNMEGREEGRNVIFPVSFSFGEEVEGEGGVCAKGAGVVCMSREARAGGRRGCS